MKNTLLITMLAAALLCSCNLVAQNNDANEGQKSFDVLDYINFALIYEHGDGNGQSKDSVKAFYWYKRAFEKDKVSGSYFLGRCYEYGIGTDIDGAKAFEMYDLCAADTSRVYKLLSGYSLVALGHCYYEGIGVGKDVTKAVECWQAVLNGYSHLGTRQKAREYLRMLQ